MPRSLRQLRTQLRLHGPLPHQPRPTAPRTLNRTTHRRQRPTRPCRPVRFTAPTWRADAIAALLAPGVIGTGIAYVISYRIISDDGPVLASTVTYLLPVVAVILGDLVLGEPITVQLAAGVAIVLAGVALTRRKRATAQPDHQARTAESGSS